MYPDRKTKKVGTNKQCSKQSTDSPIAVLSEYSCVILMFLFQGQRTLSHKVQEDK